MVAATAPSIQVLVAARPVQGVCGAVFPLSFSILRERLPPERVRGGIGTSAGIVALAADAGEAGIATSINSVLRRVGGGIGAQMAAVLPAAIPAPGGTQPTAAAFTIAFSIAAAAAVVGAVCATPPRLRTHR